MSGGLMEISKDGILGATIPKLGRLREKLSASPRLISGGLIEIDRDGILGATIWNVGKEMLGTTKLHKLIRSPDALETNVPDAKIIHCATQFIWYQAR